MDKSISEELARAAIADSRELDRICEHLAEGFLEREEEPPFRVGSAHFAGDGDGELITADRYWRLRFLRLPTVSTAVHCARWLRDHVDTEIHQVVAQRWALGYAFVTKDNIESGAEVENCHRANHDR